MATLDHNSDLPDLPALDPMGNPLGNLPVSEQPGEKDYANNKGVLDRIQGWIPSLVLILLGIIFVIVAFVSTDTGKAAIKTAIKT